MKKYFSLFIIIGTATMIVVIIKTGATLQPATTNGILDLELAYSTAKATNVINAWAATDNINAAKTNTWFDFIFIFFYSLFLYNTCNFLSKSFTSFLNRAGRLLAKAAIAAGILDILENMGMLITLNGFISSGITFLTAFFSFIKWMLVIALVLYMLVAGTIVLVKKIQTN